MQQHGAGTNGKLGQGEPSARGGYRGCLEVNRALGFAHVEPRSAFAAFNGIALEVDALAGLADTERYTYVYDNLMEQLDHMFVSPAVALRKVEVEHVHVNSWAPSYDDKTSDHDPSVARVRVCGL